MDTNDRLLTGEKEYRKLSKTFRFYKLAALALCLIFLVGGLMVFKDDITVESLRYLVRYLDLGSASLDSTEALIAFDAGEASGSRAGLYKNDLVLANQNNFEVFDFHGGKIYNDTYSMARPSMSISSSHVLVYDLGGKQLRLYNSFSLLTQEIFDYPIFCADADNNGRYAVATSEKNYHCAVYVYNQSHSRVFRWLSADKYVSDIALSDDFSRRLAVAAFRAQDGDVVSELLVFNTDDPEAFQTFSFPGEMPLKTFVGGERVRLLTDRALHTVDTETGDITTVSFDAEKLSMYGFFDDYSVVVLNDNTVGIHQEALICSQSGEKIQSILLDEQIHDIGQFKENVCFLLADSVLRADLAEKTTVYYPLKEEYTQLCMAGDQTVVLISPSHAKLTVLTTEEQTESPSGTV